MSCLCPPETCAANQTYIRLLLTFLDLLHFCYQIYHCADHICEYCQKYHYKSVGGSVSDYSELALV
jgi:hypothetical protein